mmetsp:Transcript_5091/g.12034  ORF Transcript_5091/g.12034 Transcript_5091/m.12034 type:complete len:131 (+) Transcript_5091:44-436(+)
MLLLLPPSFPAAPPPPFSRFPHGNRPIPAGSHQLRQERMPRALAHEFTVTGEHSNPTAALRVPDARRAVRRAAVDEPLPGALRGGEPASDESGLYLMAREAADYRTTRAPAAAHGLPEIPEEHVAFLAVG